MFMKVKLISISRSRGLRYFNVYDSSQEAFQILPPIAAGDVLKCKLAISIHDGAVTFEAGEIDLATQQQVVEFIKAVEDYLRFHADMNRAAESERIEHARGLEDDSGVWG